MEREKRMRADEGGNRTVSLDVAIWYNAATGNIHLAGRGSRRFISTVNADPQNRRGHPNLFKKLARVLEQAGKPHPPVDD